MNKIANTEPIRVVFFAFILCVISAAGIDTAQATSRTYSSIERLVSDSNLIAIVAVAAPNEAVTTKRTKSHPFTSKTSARIIKIIKGDAPDMISVLHTSGRDDCLFQQGPGEYLVFLKRSADGYVPTDGWPSSKRVIDGFIIGWSDTHSWDIKDSLANVLTKLEGLTSASNAK